MHPMLNIAVRAARNTGNLIVQQYELIKFSSEIKKDKKNNIANIHLTARRILIDIIHKFYPQHIIIINNNDKLIEKNEKIRWLINLMDEGTNFINSVPHFSISIAIRVKRKTEVAVIYDPIRNELFTAVRGQGAQLNNYRLRSNKDTLNCMILATCLPFKFDQSTHHAHISLFSKLSNQYSVKFRHMGSTALDLAYVAAGRFDGCFDINLKPYDFIAGILIVREAGGLVTDFIGNHDYIISGNIVAGNPRIVKIILTNIRDELNTLS